MFYYDPPARYPIFFNEPAAVHWLSPITILTRAPAILVLIGAHGHLPFDLAGYYLGRYSTLN